MEISGSLISLLSQGLFHARYYETVLRLATIFRLECQLDENQLEVAHALWESEIVNSLSQGHIAPSDNDLWINVLSALSYHMCSARCVSYSATDRQGKNLRELQALLMEFPNEYTGLEFVKTLHMEIFFRLRTHHIVWNSIAGIQLAFPELDAILREVRVIPATARDYVRLLRLPAD